MWRTPIARKGRNILHAARKLATESATPQQNVPPRIPQPTSNSGGVKALKFIGFSLPLVVGGAVGYAWYDADFRKQIEDSIPYARELFENIFPKDDKSVSVSRTKKPETSLEKASILNAQEEAAKSSPQQSASRKSDSQASGLTASLQKTNQAAQKQSDKISPSVTEPLLLTKEKDGKADNAALEVVIHKLATNSNNLVAEAIKAQAEVAACIRKQTNLLQQALDDKQDVLQKDAQWEAVAVAGKEKELAMIRANELVSESKKVVEKLRDVLQEGRSNPVTQNNPAIIPASKQYNDLLKDLNNGNLQVKQAEAEANVVQKYKDLVDKGKKLFQSELDSLMPTTKFGSGKKLTQEELNTLIAHAHRRVEQLQRQVAEQLAMEKQRLAAALEAQRQEDLKVTNQALFVERQRLQEEFSAEKSKLDEEYLDRVENEVRKQLARQAAAHSDHLREALATQEEKLNVDFNRSLHTILLEERHTFHSEIIGWVSRLQGIEAAVEARATSEKLARYAQDLWLACISLNSALEFKEDKEDQETTPLRERIEVILEAGNKHPFVETVARSFPKAALDRGVSTQTELEHRFRKVSRICRRLGLVDRPNSSLYKYLISYLHSFVVLDNVVATTEDREVDLAKLDNFALISHAQYWMEKGNLDIALRFMVQLTGESRRAASDWIEEARLLLESKQIANTLTAYASATGLANIL